MEAAVSKTCLVRFDRNQYSVEARAVGRPVDVQAYAEKIVIRQDGERVGEHVRCFSRNQVIYDPWHYMPVLKRKPGALRNGAPFMGTGIGLADAGNEARQCQAAFHGEFRHPENAGDFFNALEGAFVIQFFERLEFLHFVRLKASGVFKD